MVGLAKVAYQAKFLGEHFCTLPDLIERGVPVNVRLTTTQQVQVRAVKDEDGAVHGRPGALFGKNDGRSGIDSV
jgi:hypothetical protein